MDIVTYALCKKYTNKHITGDISVSKNPDYSITISSGDGSSATITPEELLAKATYAKTITTPSNIWMIPHNLKTSWKELTIIITDQDNNRTAGNIDLSRTTDNLLVIEFTEPISGTVYIKK